MTVVVSYLIFFVILLCITGVPGYVIAERRGLSKPWVAFIPIVGFWIVLCESVGRSGWLTLWILVPYLGALGPRGLDRVHGACPSRPQPLVDTGIHRAAREPRRLLVLRVLAS